MYVKIKRMADILKPGEICSIDQALKLGLYDIDSDSYISNSTVDLTDTRTYNPSEPNDYTKKKAFCRQYQSDKISYPLCPLVGGVPYTQAPGDPSRCLPAKCPPGFTQNPSDITECKKPNDYMFAGRNQECEEKPEDWYTIPNYHLGNRYTRVGDGCYKPCEANMMPVVRTDPVDGEQWNISSGDSNIYGQKCTYKANYMNGKYEKDANYCPIAVIKRLSTIPSLLQEEMQQKIKTLPGGIPNRSDIIRKINTNIATDATRIASECHQSLENIKSGTKPFQIACEKMVSSEEIQEAYDVCKNLKYHPNKLLGKWREELSNDAEDISIKRAVLEQACHEVFCNKPENAMEVGESALCFTPKNVDVSIYNSKWSGESISAPSRSPETASDSGPVRTTNKIQPSSVKAPNTQFVTDFLNKGENLFIGGVIFFASIMMLYFLVIRKGSQLVNSIAGRCKA